MWSVALKGSVIILRSTNFDGRRLSTRSGRHTWHDAVRKIKDGRVRHDHVPVNPKRRRVRDRERVGIGKGRGVPAFVKPVSNNLTSVQV